jgi:hypothetical protein
LITFFDKNQTEPNRKWSTLTRVTFRGRKKRMMVKFKILLRTSTWDWSLTHVLYLRAHYWSKL